MEEEEEEISDPAVLKKDVKTASELESEDPSPEKESAPDEEKGSEEYSEVSEKESGEPDLEGTSENIELQAENTDKKPVETEKSEDEDAGLIEVKKPPEKLLDPDDPDGDRKRKISFGQVPARNWTEIDMSAKPAEVDPPTGTDPEATIRRLRAANQRLRRELAGFTKTLDDRLSETNPMTPRKSRPSMQHDDIEVVRYQLENKEKALANLQKSYNRMEQMWKSSESAENLLKLNNKVSELKIEIKTMKEENRTLMMVSRRTEKSYTSLESDQKGFPEKIESLEKELRACRESLKRSNLESTEKDRMLRKVHDKMSTLDLKCRRLQDELDGKVPIRKPKSIEKLTTERDEAVDKLADVEERLSEQRNRFVAQIQKSDRTRKALENELGEMTREIQRLESLPRPPTQLHDPKHPKPRIAGTPSREKKLRQHHSSASKPPAGTRLPPVRAKKIVPKSSGYGAAKTPKKVAKTPKKVAKRTSKDPLMRKPKSKAVSKPAEPKNDGDEHSIDAEPAEPEIPIKSLSPEVDNIVDTENTEDTVDTEENESSADSGNLETGAEENQREKDEPEKVEKSPEKEENSAEEAENTAENDENSPENYEDPPENDETPVTGDDDQADPVNDDDA